MTGRDPREEHRVATPLELLFDLTFVVSFGVAAAQFAHALAEGHFTAGLLGFGLTAFAICWAWTNFSWFASAYDTDDWLFRVATMVQMSGVLVLGLGVPRMFASIEHGPHLDAGMMVIGYVIMRLAMVFQWLRAARQDPTRHRATWTYAILVSAVQLGWVALVAAAPPLGVAITLYVLLALAEVAAPVLAEHGEGTPWHAHHIAERYSLFAIIALGEGIVGTVAALSAVVEEQGWTLDAALACIAGMGLTFGMWWVYYMLPSAEILHHHRNRAIVWAYGQLAIIAAIVATGAGLHVAAYFIEHKAHIGALATILCVATPVGIFLACIYALYAYLVRRFDPFHFWLLLGTIGTLVLAVMAAASGVGMATCLLIVTLAPLVTVIGYELLGHRHKLEVLAEQTAADPHRS
jgi:low temperature requirement protein LtrA